MLSLLALIIYMAVENFLQLIYYFTEWLQEIRNCHAFGWLYYLTSTWRPRSNFGYSTYAKPERFETSTSLWINTLRATRGKEEERNKRKEKEKQVSDRMETRKESDELSCDRS